METLDIEKLQFPQAIAPVIGLRKEEIGFMKKKGCKFYKRKTTIRWVREFLESEASR